jgi:hypothetical protein
MLQVPINSGHPLIQ